MNDNLNKENLETTNKVEKVSLEIQKKEKKEFLSLKTMLLILSLVLVIGGSITFSSISYNSLLSDFKNYFDGKYYSTANNVLISNGNLNVLKAMNLNNDLKDYFIDKLNTLKADLESSKINSDEAILVISEINRYNILDKEIDEAIASASSNINESSVISNGILEYQNGNFKGALAIFEKIPPNHSGYNTALDYTKKSKTAYKESLFKDAEKLASEHYYTKAIDLLTKELPTFKDDADVSKKIEQLKISKDEYIKNTNSAANGYTN